MASLSSHVGSLRVVLLEKYLLIDAAPVMMPSTQLSKTNTFCYFLRAENSTDDVILTDFSHTSDLTFADVMSTIFYSPLAISV